MNFYNPIKALKIATCFPAVILAGVAGIRLNASEIATIPGEISDGTPSPPAPKPELPDFKIESTLVRRMRVEEAPEMPGLPTVRGTITTTVHMVADPGLPDPPPPPLPVTSVDDPLAQARLAEMEKEFPATQLVFLSATVYDHSRTLLRCNPGGGAKHEISVWSNLDFNHFSGFTSFEVKGSDGVTRSYGLLMGIGNEETGKTAEDVAENGVNEVAPEIPALPDDEPAYVVVQDGGDKEQLEIIENLHELYRAEGARMEAAYHARIKALDERRAFLLANPPVPKNVTVRFWKRHHPVGTAGRAEEQPEGANP